MKQKETEETIKQAKIEQIKEILKIENPFVAESEMDTGFRYLQVKIKELLN